MPNADGSVVFATDLDMENLQLEENEYELVRQPQKGVCLYKCGSDRHLLAVHAPPHKEKLFGSAGGR